MKKKYWWRGLVSLISLVSIGVAYVIGNQLLFGICDNIYSFGDNQGCLDSSKKTIGEPLFLVSLSLFSVSIFLFFVHDAIFLKWLKFAIGWIMFSIVLISITPSSVHSFSPLAGPDRETVSIWMGSLFAIISLIQIIWLSIKNKNS